MKRIGTFGVVVTFVGAATTALAGCCTPSYPSGAQQASGTYPSAASHEGRQMNRSACTVYTPDWPYEVQGP
jgi:hypothetical protein